MTRARRARVTFAAISSRSTAAVESRSSQKAIGSSVSRARVRAKARGALGGGTPARFGYRAGGALRAGPLAAVNVEGNPDHEGAPLPFRGKRKQPRRIG